MRRKTQQAIRQLAFSILVVGVALALTEVLYRVDKPLQAHGVFTFFLAAIAIAAWRGGVLSATVTTILCTLIVAWLMPPDHSLRIDSQEDIVRLGLFVFIAVLVSYLHYARQKAEKSLQESERRLHFSLDSSGVACWDANVKDGTFWRSLNLAEVFGRTQADFASTYEGFFSYVHPEDREFFHLASVGGGSNVRDFEIAHRIVCGNGTIRRVSTRGKMYIDDEGRVERMVGAVFALDNKLSAPASSHPLRTPLTEIASAFLI